ncbi:MAG: heterodisulfide reductase subunit C [Saprospiraceae bacterium]|jgi:heterodisulfide reductase subunit C
MLQQIIFIIITLSASYWAYNQFMKIRRNIFLGKEEDISGDEGARWKNVLLVAFGQKKMFKNWIPAVLHFFIYAAFVITQIELIEIFIDGFFGVHRFFADKLGIFYTFIISFIEILTILALVATIAFLARRNLLKIPRFHKSEMTWWPKLDANLILFGELALITGILSMNGADTVLQNVNPEAYHNTGFFAISGWLGPLLFGSLPEGVLVLVERFGWWLHILTVLAFLNYLPSSKHLHILFAFPNTWYAKLTPKGEMQNMPEVMDEVKSMMGLTEDTGEAATEEELPEFGANDIFGLSWKNIMDAYTCTECGRCTAVCPANLTGKKLSPRKILMDIRDRATEVGENLDSGHQKFIEKEARIDGVALTKDNYDDGKTLFDYISREELHACTTCNACVEACPVLINPLEPILKMRRYEILTESAGPSDWLPMFTSIENSGSVWQVPDERVKWAKDALEKE